MVPVTIRAQYQAQQTSLIGIACTEYNNFLGYVLMPTWSSNRGQLWLSETACMKALAGQNVNLDRDRMQYRRAMHYLTIIKFGGRKSEGDMWESVVTSSSGLGACFHASKCKPQPIQFSMYIGIDGQGLGKGKTTLFQMLTNAQSGGRIHLGSPCQTRASPAKS
jgi:hypothetical protein